MLWHNEYQGIIANWLRFQDNFEISGQPGPLFVFLHVLHRRTFKISGTGFYGPLLFPSSNQSTEAKSNQTHTSEILPRSQVKLCSFHKTKLYWNQSKTKRQCRSTNEEKSTS